MSLPKSVLKDKFEVLHKISEGGMGAVYKVRHRLLNQPFVIKVIRSQHEGDENLQKRFLQEARAAIRLRHVNIAEIKDFSIGDDRTAYIVMEFIEGATLKQILASQGPPDLGLTLEIADQSLKALGFLHRQGYIHRDVSPDNLMLTRTPDDEPLIKLIDLGLAKRLESEGDLTTTGMFLGKVRYSAPEQFKGEPLDHRSDLYSFGVMLYQLLTGHSPIEGAEFSQFIAAHLFKDPVDFEQSDPTGRVPPALRQVVLKTLEKDRDRRVQSAEELAALLMPFREPAHSSLEDFSETIALRTDDQTPALPQHTAAQRILEAVTSGTPPRSREASVARVEEDLRQRELDEATAALGEAEREHGNDESTQELRGQLEDLRRKERDERMKVRTTVDRQRVARPQKNLVLGAAAAALLALAILGWVLSRSSTVQLTPAQKSYQHAQDAIQNDDLASARQALLRALELDPVEKPEGPYLPHFLLGIVNQKRFNCIDALENWQDSELQGVIQQTDNYPIMRDGQDECRAEFSPRVQAVDRVKDSAAEYASILKGALQNSALEGEWLKSPELKEKIEKSLQEFDVLQTRLEDAKEREDYFEIDKLEEPLLEQERQLEALLEELGNR